MLKVVRDENGSISLRDLPPISADTLLRIPDLLLSQDPRVRGRLLPRVFQEDDDEDQWERYAAPELEHLFRSREELIRKDLMSLTEDGAYTFRLDIVDKHVSAWIAGLNAARLTLFVLNGLSADDMDAEPTDVEGDDRQLALFRIHNLALIQEMLMRAKARQQPGPVPFEDESSFEGGDGPADDGDGDDDGPFGDGG